MQKELDQVTLQDIQDLISYKVQEGVTIDYKHSIDLTTDKGKLDLLKDISSFANTDGGDIILGISENKETHIPERVCSFDIQNWDHYKNTILSLCNRHISPNIDLNLKQILTGDNKSLVIIRIYQSWLPPHRVDYLEDKKYYLRNEHGKYIPDTNSLRKVFNMQENIKTTIKDFVSSRISEIRRKNTPIKITDSQPGTLILHTYPFSATKLGAELSIKPIYDLYQDQKNSDRNLLRPLGCRDSWYGSINLEGFLVADSRGKTEQNYYTQYYRNMISESVNTNTVTYAMNDVFFRVHENREVLLGFINNYRDLLKRFRLGSNFYINISILNTKGVIVTYDNKEGVINQSDIMLPGLIIQDNDNLDDKVDFIIELIRNSADLP